MFLSVPGSAPNPPRLNPPFCPLRVRAGGSFTSRGVDNLQTVCIVWGVETMTEERRQVQELYEAGWTVRQIAKELDVSTQRVYQQLKALDLPAPGKAQ